MKRIITNILLFGAMFLGVCTSLTANAEVQDGIKFIIKNETGIPNVSGRCGNFSYPGVSSKGPGSTYDVEPRGLIFNPRKLQYTCSISGSLSGKDVAYIFPSSFDHAKATSEVVLTIHHSKTEKKTSLGAIFWEEEMIFSLSVDGKVLADKKKEVFFLSSLMLDNNPKFGS